MDFHSIPNYTQLKLELALNPTPSSTAENTTKKPNYPTSDHPQPSLTLALSGDSCGVGSSFSNANTHVIKRETEVASCESEKGVENLNISGEYDEDGGVNGKKKLRLTKAQSGLLEQAFRLHTTLHPKEKQKLARDLKLRPRQVEVWFQNRRARTKMKQTEMDCEYLKKWRKTLTDENQRLRQQIQQLKVQAQPMYMAATLLTVCPSCQQTRDTNSAPTKPYLFNPFTTSSAAC